MEDDQNMLETERWTQYSEKCKTKKSILNNFCKVRGEPDRNVKDKVGHIEDNPDTSSEVRNDKIEKDNSDKTCIHLLYSLEIH
jgi:hypothetical protein